MTTGEQYPCHLFTEDADMVVLYLDMVSADEVQLGLPRAYLEDRADQQSGLRHGSPLLRVMVGNFLPVSRAQALRLSATRQRDNAQRGFVTMLFSDFPNLDVRLNFLSPTPLSTPPNDIGLIPVAGADPTSRLPFAALHPDGTTSALLECAAPETRPRATCTHQLRTSGVDVVLDYGADLLPIWADVQARVERSWGCAAAG